MSSLKSLAARGLQAMDFPPTMKPRKDGRYHSISPKQRQKRVIRIIIGIATATAIYTCLLYSGKTASNDVKHYYLAGYYDSWGAATVHTTTSPSRTEDEKCADERAKTIEDAFQKLIAVVPDEADARDLLRPIEGSGTERLRDLGIRTRVYKRLLDAWEELHLISIENSLYIRDDVMQHLWSRGTKVSKLSPSGFAELVRSYESYRSLILNLGSLLFPWTAPHFPDHMTLHTQISHGGRGIVTTAGNDQALYLLTTITMMRKLGCKLPIEIMYLGIDDLDQNHRDSFERISGVVLRDIRQMVNDQGWEIKGWAGKPFAILLSSFKEVIFVDADALFFEDPAVLFEDPAYIETGALFFHDRLMMPGNKRSWLKEILPEPITKSVQRSRLWTGQSVHMQESGVVLIDKWRHFVPMLLVSRMNGPDRDGNKEKGITGVYDMLYGDKETFWIGWELVGDEGYAFHQGPAGIIGALEPQKEKEKARGDLRLCSPQLLHMGLEGSPLWFNGWIFKNKFHGQAAEVVSFESYMRETSQITKPEVWELGKDNVCCLSGNISFNFTEREKTTLQRIVDTAIQVGAYHEPKTNKTNTLIDDDE